MKRNQLDSHPLVVKSLDAEIANLSSIDETRRIVKMLGQIYGDHMSKPFDAIVGDDVSGRGPTLIAHRFLRLTYAAGKIETIPRTFFASSGILRDLGGRSRLELENKWQQNLTAQAKLLTTTHGLSRVALLTEIISGGRAIGRLKKAFNPFVDEVGVFQAGSNGFYTHRIKGEGLLRGMLGVEKSPPDAVSHRSPCFDGVGSALLRSFLNDYASFAFSEIFDESAPEVTSVDRSSYAPVPNVIKA